MSPSPQQTTPELLRAILNVNPNIFDQQQQGNHWNNHMHPPKFNGMSPTYNYTSESVIHSSPSSHVNVAHGGILQNQQSLAIPSQSSPHVNIGSPPSQSRPGNLVPIQNNISPLWNNANSSTITYATDGNYTSVGTGQKVLCPNSQNGGFYNSIVNESSNFSTSMNQEMDPLAMSPQNQPDNSNHSQAQGVYRKDRYYLKIWFNIFTYMEMIQCKCTLICTFSIFNLLLYFEVLIL